MKAELNRNRTIGCEFEFFLPKFGQVSNNSVQQTLASILTANGFPAIARTYSHMPVPLGNDLAVEVDGSIVGSFDIKDVPHAAVEMKTRILNADDWERIVPAALNIVNSLSSRVNYSTGYHVHLGIPEVTARPAIIKSLFNLFYRFEPVIFGLVSPSRTNNQYCRAIPADLTNIFQRSKSSKSYVDAVKQPHCKNGLNLSHLISGDRFSQSPRIEIRYHQGTLDIEKARHWLRFCLQMIEHACNRNCRAYDQVANDRAGLERLLICCGFKPNSGIYKEVSPELRDTGKFLIARWKKFNGNIPLKSCKKAPAKSSAESAA